MQRHKIAHHPLYLVISLILLLGIFFRFANLEGKLYWHDEVYTSFRIAGYTRAEIDDTLFQNKWVTPQDLQKFQQLKPGSTFNDTIHSLATEDPQHPPFYFLIARLWLQVFGNSLTTNRTLPVLLSLLSFLFIYLLAKELFASTTTALIAVALFAVSPVHVLFDQTARQYGLLTTGLIASGFFLLKSLKSPKYFIPYTLTNTLGLYTHPFFVLTVIGHGVYVLWLCWKKQQAWANLGRYGGAIALSFALYIPWIVVMIENSQRALSGTSWTKVPTGLINLIQGWIFCFGSILMDFDFGANNLDNPWTYLIKLPAIGLMIWAIYSVCRHTKPDVYLFILTSIFVPFLLLALPDVIFGGIRSVVARYLLNCFPAIQLAIAFLLHQLLQPKQRLGYIIFALVFTISILACSLNAFSNTSWTKDISYYNYEVVKKINESPNGVVIADLGEYNINTAQLLSLSYFLNQDVRLFLLKLPPNPEVIQQRINNTQGEIFIFAPSPQLKQTLETKIPQHFELIFPAGNLYKLSGK